MVPQKTEVDKATGLETATLGLRFLLHPKLIQKDRVAIKCTASIEEGRYWDSRDMNIFIKGIVPQASHINERDTSSAISHQYKQYFLGKEVVICSFIEIFIMQITTIALVFNISGKPLLYRLSLKRSV